MVVEEAGEEVQGGGVDMGCCGGGGGKTGEEFGV